MAPPRRTQVGRTEETRRRLVEAAQTVLAAKGYRGLRTEEVSAIAGVSRGAQTHHFPSKDDLIIAVADHVLQKANEPTRRRRTHFASVDDAIKELLAESQTFFFSELFLVALDLGIQYKAEDAQRSELSKVTEASRLPVEQAWQETLISTGVPAQLADDLMWLTVGIVRGMAIRRIWRDDPPRFRRLFRLWRQMVRVFLDANQQDENSRSGGPRGT